MKTEFQRTGIGFLREEKQDLWSGLRRVGVKTIEK